MNKLPNEIFKELLNYIKPNNETNKFVLKFGYRRDADEFYNEDGNIYYVSSARAINNENFQGRIKDNEEFCMTMYIKTGLNQIEKTSIFHESTSDFRTIDLDKINTFIKSIETDEFTEIKYKFVNDHILIDKNKIGIMVNIYNNPNDLSEEQEVFGRSLFEMPYSKEMAINILEQIRNSYLFIKNLENWTDPDEIEDSESDEESEPEEPIENDSKQDESN